MAGSANPRLNIQAEVSDRFTGTLNKLKTGMAEVRTEGVKHTGALRRDFEGFHGTLTKATGALQGFTAPLSALGIVGFGAGAGLMGLGTALRGLSKDAQSLSILSRETGISINQLRAFQSIGERFGVSRDAILQYADTFSRVARDVKKNWGEAVQSLPKMGLGDLLADLQNSKSTEEMMMKALKALPKISNLDAQRRVSMIFFGTEDVGRIMAELGDTVGETFDKVRGRIGDLNPAMQKAAKDYEANLARMRDAQERAKIGIIGPILGVINEDVIDAFTKREEQYQKEKATKADPRAKSIRDTEGRLRDAEQRYSYNEKTYSPTDARLITRQKELRDEIAKLTEELKRLREGGATVQQQSFSGGGFGAGGLIHRAAFGTGFGGGFGGIGGGFGRGGYGGGSSLPGPVAPPDAPRVDAPVRPSRPPAFRGTLEGQGSERAAGRNQFSDVTANPGAYKDVLDHIAKSEGTAHRPSGGYNTSLGYGRYLPGRQEQNLTSMSLDQISELGRYMRRQPGNPNSSALGRYQIVGNTMRRLMRRMGVKGDELFDEKMQDRMGAELARGRGASATGLGQEWESLRGEKLARAVELMRKVDPAASTVPQDRAVASDSSDPASARRMFDDTMRTRLYGEQAPVARGGNTRGSLHITLDGFPTGTKVKESMSDLFQETRITKQRRRSPEIMSI